MKKIVIFLNLILIIFLISCKKSDVGNTFADFSNLGIGSYLIKDSIVNLSFTFNDPTSTVSVKVDQYGSPIDSIDIFIANPPSISTSTWRYIKTVQFVGKGTLLSVTEAEVANALGINTNDFIAGDSYTLYNRIHTKDGRVFDVSNTPNALSVIANYNSIMSWKVNITCPFTGNMAGNYTVIQDDWGDWLPADVVAVSDGPGANQINLSNVWPNPIKGVIVEPLIVDIDPATGAAFVPLVHFGDYPGVTTAKGAGSTNTAGYVFSCTGLITLSMEVKYNGASKGFLKLKLQKN